MSTNSNNNILATVSKSNQLPSDRKKLELTEIIDDAKRTAREDIITWGQVYQHYYREYKEEARMIICAKLRNNLPSIDGDLDESMFNELPNPSMFTSHAKTTRGESK